MKTFFLIFSLLVSNFSFAQKDADRIATAFKKFETDSQFKHASISLYIIDTKTGKVIFDKNSQVGLAPASCLKVVTSAAAFDLLGKDYRYTTDVNYNGDITHDTLHGNLHINGSGDPTLGSFRWKSTTMDLVIKNIFKALQDKNIKVITGNLTMHEINWETQATPRGWTWDDIGNYYGAGARGFNWNENQYDMFLRTGKKIGDEVEIIETKPPLKVSFINELTTAAAGSGDRSIIYLPEDGSLGFIRGTVPAGESKFKVSGSLPEPALAFLNAFEEGMKANNIILRGSLSTNRLLVNKDVISPIPQTTLLTIASPTLDSINYWFLQKSVNLFGEAFVKMISYNKTQWASTDTGVNIIKDFWSKNGIEKSALHMIDGSGLSPANRITTNALVTVMQYAKKQSWYPSFYNALPEQNGIKMKSGYIGGVRSYTGYIRSKLGTEYTFSFIINNYDGNPGAVREKMWKLLDIIK
jgi:D-alanyl-D-alanine carboxypeptidase/D-alanyl-D-alanine-endopeptidase (penicillin-binding protein 4)